MTDRGGLLARPYSQTLVLAGLAAQLLGVYFMTGGDPGSLVFALPIMLPAILLVGLAVAKGRPWAYLGAAITIILLPLLLLAFAPDYITKPQYGPAFTGAVFAVLSIVLTTPAGLWVYLHRRQALPVLSVRDGLRTRHGILTVLVTGMCFGAVAAGQAAYLNASAGGSSAADFTADVQVSLDAEAFLFVPDTVNVPVGQLVELTVVNKDAVFHTFTYTLHAGQPNEVTYNHDLLPSSTAKFLVLITAPGDIPFWCIPHRDMGMVGTIHVT